MANGDNSNGCKYFLHEPYMNPNNYDLYFDYNSIPANIQPEKAHDLRNRLQKLMPLTKIIHLNMGNESLEESNNLHMHTRMNLHYTRSTSSGVEEVTVEVKIK